MTETQNPPATVEERYTTAANTSNLTVKAEKGGAGDLIIAAGYSRHLIGTALIRLHGECCRVGGVGARAPRANELGDVMDISLNLDVRNLESVRGVLEKLSGKQAKEAYAKAVNDAAFQAQREMRKTLKASFDRVTPYIERSPKVLPATFENLSASILPTLDARNKPSAGGKVGVDPQYILQAQEFGGRRADKKSEKRLRQAGLLPAGYQTVIPRDPYPGSDDGRGNIRGTFMQQLLSYFATYTEAGYKANMGARRKARLEDRTTMSLLSNRREVKVIRGVAYFVAWGPLRTTRGGSHLAPGIWAKTGTGGAVVRPVLMFVRAPSYQPRLSMDAIAKTADLQTYLDKRVRFRIRQAAGI